MQLARFSQAAAARCGLGEAVFSSWRDAIAAFSRIGDQGGEARTVVVLDECQWIAKARPGFLAELRAGWEAWTAEELSAGQHPPLLILRGCADAIRLGPLPFIDAAELCPGYSPAEKLFAYAALGGSPAHWQGFRPESAPGENIARTVLRSGAPLHDEPEAALMLEFREPAAFSAVLAAMAQGAESFSGIARASGASSRLLRAGLIEMKAPLLASGRAARSRYRLADGFFRFWYRFVASSSLEAGTTSKALGLWRTSIEPCMLDFATPAFERLCRERLERLASEGKLSGIPSRADAHRQLQALLPVKLRQQLHGRIGVGESNLH